jgi:hypothetical protein
MQPGQVGQERQAKDRRRQIGRQTQRLGLRMNLLGRAGENLAPKILQIEGASPHRCRQPLGWPTVLMLAEYGADVQPTPLYRLFVERNGFAAEQGDAVRAPELDLLPRKGQGDADGCVGNKIRKQIAENGRRSGERRALAGEPIQFGLCGGDIRIQGRRPTE